MSTLPPWDSDAFDREVRAERARDSRSAPKKKQQSESARTVAYDGVPRGLATPEDLQRRAEVERAMRSRTKKGAQ